MLPDPPILHYTARPRSRGSPARTAAILILTAALTMAHLWYTRTAALRLWEWSHGIQGSAQRTGFGGTDWAWTVPAHLPAGLVFYACVKIRGIDGFRSDPTPFGMVAILLIFAGSIAASLFLACFLAALFWRDRPVTGRCYWRLWCVLLGWAWFPVPAAMSWVFQWTVVY